MKNNGTPMVHRIPVKDRDGRTLFERDVPSYAGLLDLAHADRLESVTTEILQFASTANDGTTIVRATVKTSRGTFSAIGDANPHNVNSRIAPHTVRMAETRSVARALRTAVNVGAVAIEELMDDDAREPEPPPPLPANDNVRAAVVVNPPPTAPPTIPLATEQQRRLVARLLAERGLDGERAAAFVHERLGVASLRDAARGAVSQLIDQLKNNGHTQREAAGG